MRTQTQNRGEVTLVFSYAQDVKLLDELKLNRLDGGGSGEHNTAIAQGRVQLVDSLPCHSRRTVKVENENLLLDDGGKGGPESQFCLLQEGGGHHLDYERLTIGEHERKQRPNNRRLAAAHKHLFH